MFVFFTFDTSIYNFYNVILSHTHLVNFYGGKRFMKKIFAMILVLALALCSTAFAATSVDTIASEFELTGDPASIKIGVILIGDENEGYTLAHIEGIREAAANLGIDEETQIIWKYTVSEDSTCYETALDLVDSGCNLVVSNSYGHQSYMEQAAMDVPEVQFISMTGDTANKSGLDNFANAFTKVYESRYLSGVVAGMKVAELIETGALGDANYDADGNVKIGYVGAYPYAEVVSGYTAFYLGVKSVVENVAMEVSYTNSWFDIVAEGEAANALMADGCVIIGQHADSTGAPAAVQAAQDNGKVAYSVGYNIDMLAVAPTAALTSATNVWNAYYEYAFKTIINGEELANNWSAGFSKGAVAITELGASCAEGTAEKVAEVQAALTEGTLKVFDTTTFTVGGEVVTSALATDTDGDWVNDADEAIIDGAYNESYFQSAPSFALRIDGITELN